MQVRADDSVTSKQANQQTVSINTVKIVIMYGGEAGPGIRPPTMDAIDNNIPNSNNVVSLG